MVARHEIEDGMIIMIQSVTEWRGTNDYDEGPPTPYRIFWREDREEDEDGYIWFNLEAFPDGDALSDGEEYAMKDEDTVPLYDPGSFGSITSGR
jgi:hypothetical protein